ncbi:MAG: hypothetical protein MPJ50_17010 [Pirellulales bacterium]|nr:hypothetical protein [Pirellulales bacterium]
MNSLLRNILICLLAVLVACDVTLVGGSVCAKGVLAGSASCCGGCSVDTAKKSCCAETSQEVSCQCGQSNEPQQPNAPATSISKIDLQGSFYERLENSQTHGLDWSGQEDPEFSSAVSQLRRLANLCRWRA